MPRKDGLDTNEEMRADFNAKSHEVFHRAYERKFGDKIPDEFKDKKLVDLRLRIDEEPSNVIDSLKERGLIEADAKSPAEDDLIWSQQLDITPLNSNEANSMKYRLHTRDYPKDTLDYYAQIAKRIGGITLSDQPSVRSEVPVPGIIADWSGNVGGRNRHVGTFKEKPTKFSLTLGKKFADDALQFVESDSFDDPSAHSALVRSLRDGKKMRADFTLDYSPNTKLNGHESEAWLREYERRMRAALESTEHSIERLNQSNPYKDNKVMDRYKEIRAEYATALAHVRSILEKK